MFSSQHLSFLQEESSENSPSYKIFNATPRHFFITYFLFRKISLPSFYDNCTKKNSNNKFVFLSMHIRDYNSETKLYNNVLVLSSHSRHNYSFLMIMSNMIPWDVSSTLNRPYLANEMHIENELHMIFFRLLRTPFGYVILALVSQVIRTIVVSCKFIVFANGENGRVAR